VQCGDIPNHTLLLLLLLPVVMVVMVPPPPEGFINIYHTNTGCFVRLV
jgi:hypothetical protein